MSRARKSVTGFFQHSDPSAPGSVGLYILFMVLVEAYAVCIAVQRVTLHQSAGLADSLSQELPLANQQAWLRRKSPWQA
jgi:hypothetical protein